MQYPSRGVADLMKWASRHGCVYQGVAQSGHVKILLPNGEVYCTSASPSDTNSVKVAQREIAKKLGLKLNKPRSGHHKRGVARRDYKPATERIDSVSARYAQHARRHRELCDLIRGAQSDGDADRARPALSELLEVEAAIAVLGRRAPLRTFRA